MNIRCVIFDMDGIIFDTEKVYYKAWVQAAKENGYVINWDIYTQIVARNAKFIKLKLQELISPDIPFDAICSRKRELANEEIFTNGIEKKPGLDELLDFLDEQGIKKVVATSSMREKSLKYLELASIRDRFDYIICGDEVDEAKPNPEIFLKAAAKVNMKPEECIVLEDSRLGIQASKAAGIKGIFIPDLVQADEEILSNAFMQAKSLSDIIRILPQI